MRTNCGEKNQNNGMQKQPRLNFPKTGKNILKLARLIYSLFLGIPLVLAQTNGNPHEPMLWKLYNLQESKLIQNKTSPGNWNFSVHLFSMIPFDQGGCFGNTCLNVSKTFAHCKAFYMCPASNPGKSYCNYPGHFYCGYWGCETIASDWGTTPDKYISVTWGPPGCDPPQHGHDGSIYNCAPIQKDKKGGCWRIEIKIKQPEDDTWFAGKIWGIRYWEPGTDRGSFFKIIKERIPHDPLPVGPNLVLNPPISSKKELSESQDPLWNLMQASYRALNKSKPNLTEECWLCYNIRPPYFEAIGRPGRIRWSNGSNPRECPWNDQRNHMQGITIQFVTGQGKCIGTVPKKYQPLCNRTVTNTNIEKHKEQNDKWAIPIPGAKWVCSDIGLTPCLSLNVFNQSQFCVQVNIVPRLIYHTSEEVLRHFEGDLNRQKREPITVVTLATLLIAGGVGAGTGIASLVKGQELQSLQMAVDEDLAKIEQSIQNLATSVKSLSEVVLQNRRGLDLLFLKEGGLCVALNEECCSFADHTGIVQDTMSELRKRLDQRKKDREASRSWYENWFNVSPWLTTLLSALAGPLIILILGLIFGPCLLRYILHFIKERFEIAKCIMTGQKPAGRRWDTENFHISNFFSS
uniref:Envelope glycoprotein n=1 Tax=Strix occidentalis caurina TaxID=311401 RepID=A0A8D0G0W6_STROC